MDGFIYSQKDQKRIWKKIKIVEGDGCWEWQGSIGSGGYGNTTLSRSGITHAVNAHRVVYEMHIGKAIPANVFVCHSCDNKKCCRPDHLFLGTASENMFDHVSKGKHHGTKKTHCKYGHEFTPENTKRDWRGHRYCVTCWGPKARKEKYAITKRTEGNNDK